MLRNIKSFLKYLSSTKMCKFCINDKADKRPSINYVRNENSKFRPWLPLVGTCMLSSPPGVRMHFQHLILTPINYTKPTGPGNSKKL